MTLAEMVAKYGEDEVTRWAETGRLCEQVLPGLANGCWNSELECYSATNWYVERVDSDGYSVSLGTCFGNTPLAALRAAQEGE